MGSPGSQEWLEKQRAAWGRVVRGADLLFVLLYVALAARFFMVMGGAEAGSGGGLGRLVHGVTEPFYQPFGDLVTQPPLGDGILDLPALLAIAAFGGLHFVVRRFLNLVGTLE